MRRLLPLLIGLAMLAVPAQSQAVTMKTTKFVADFEGFVSCPYADPAGHATIGYGHLLHYGPPTRRDRKKWGCLTEAKGLKLLKQDLQATEDEVLDRLRGATINAPMLTALTSFTFNLGAGYLDHQNRRGKRPATDVAKNIRRGKYMKAAREMRYFDGVIIGGKRQVLEGLRIRRTKEYKLMVQGIEQLNTCSGNCEGTSSTGGLGV